MGKLVKKIHCPFHDDKTASMAIYADGWGHCFGCGKHVKMEDGVQDVPQEEPEDIRASLDVITTCGTKAIRGLTLPSDDEFYYVVWPDKDYYKKRKHGTDKDKFKYLCPVGHRKPLYVHRPKATRGLLLIEGELNCLTAALQPGFEDFCFASPGPTTDFMRKEYLRFYEKFDRVCIIVDKDPAGIDAGIKLKAYLRARKKKVTLLALEEDLNEVYVSKGKKALLSILEKAVAVLRLR
jgi:hypothetical protein